MSTLSWEVRNTQNPALGAALLWRFSCAYKKAHPIAEHVPFPLLFIVLPVLLHEPTYEFLKGTLVSSGLHAFVAKFSDSRHSKQDLLMAVHGRAVTLRHLTLESFQVAQRGRLIQVNTAGRVVCLTETATSLSEPSTKLLLSNADKMGAWCAALTMHEVAIALKVRF